MTSNACGGIGVGCFLRNRVRIQLILLPIKVSMKNQKLSQLAVISACLLALFGCAPSDSDDSSDGSTLTGPIADLQGTYITGCLPDDGTYVSYTVKISGTNASQIGTIYSDSACTTKMAKVSDQGTNIKIGDSIGFLDGSTGYKYSVAQDSMEITSLNALMTQGFNDANTCGLTWATDVAYNVNGKTCGTDTYPVKNTTLYNIYKLDGNNLYYGEASSSSYPSTVNTIAFVKQ